MKYSKTFEWFGFEVTVEVLKMEPYYVLIFERDPMSTYYLDLEFNSLREARHAAIYAAETLARQKGVEVRAEVHRIVSDEPVLEFATSVSPVVHYERSKG